MLFDLGLQLLNSHSQHRPHLGHCLLWVLSPAICRLALTGDRNQTQKCRRLRHQPSSTSVHPLAQSHQCPQASILHFLISVNKRIKQGFPRPFCPWTAFILMIYSEIILNQILFSSLNRFLPNLCFFKMQLTVFLYPCKSSQSFAKLVPALGDCCC